MNPSPAENNVYFLAAARFGDRSVVASYCKDASVKLDVIHSLLNDPNLSLRPGARYNTRNDVCVLHFICDEQHRVYILVSSLTFPERIAFSCLDEFKTEFSAKWGDKSLVCEERELDKSCMKFMGALCTKYDDPDVDRLSSVHRKVEVVKVTMQENIKQVLENSVKLEDINQTAENLQQQAGVFKKQATTLQKQMWWRNLKMKIILATLVIAFLAAIITAIALTAGGGD